MTHIHPCSPYLLKPLRSFEEAKEAAAARRNRIAAARAALGRTSAPATPPTEVDMKPKELRDAERKQAWDTTKQAVGAYAKNPCATAEVKVAAALKEVSRLCRPCAPALERRAVKPKRMRWAG